MQWGKNFMMVFSALARAKQDTNWPKARTEFDFAFVVA
jgi:hypothetical protein